MYSISDIAREAKVANSTVSLVLNHRHRVSPETCQRVEQVIGRLGYQPRSWRKASGPSAVRHLAFLYTINARDPKIDHGMSEYCRELIEGVKSKLGESCSLSIVRSADHVDHDLIFNQQLNAREFDGVIFLGADASNGYLERLKSAGLPLVVFNHMSSDGGFSSVTADYYGGARSRVDLLAELGHRRLACFWLQEPETWRRQQIHRGTRHAAEKHGCELIEIELLADKQTPKDIQALCKQALAKKATAFLTGDHFVVRFADTVAEMGMSVPEDLSIIGFDDRHLTTKLGLKLSSVGYDRHRMGRMAMQMLQQMIEGSGKWNWMAAAASTYLFEGQTCGPVKS